MPRPIQAIVHSHALRHNLQQVTRVVRDTVSPSRVWAVIKANAYGHGVHTAVACLNEADGLALLDLQEAVRAREAGWVKPILLLEGIFDPSDLDVVQQYRLTPVVHSLEQLVMLRASNGAPLDVYLKLDTGMTRLGFLPATVDQAFEQLDALVKDKRVGKVTYMTHFACADQMDGLSEPLQRFARMTHNRPGNWCLSNSAASLMHADQVAAFAAEHGRDIWSRPGICLYGASPLGDRSAHELGLMPAMTLRAEIISVKDVPAGQGIGYGHQYTAEHDMRVGVVACGYADGYPRHAPTGTPVAVDGHLTRILGRVSMDMITVDLSGLPGAHVGSDAVLWGQGGPSVDEVAHAAGTISYELLSGVTARVPRVVA